MEVIATNIRGVLYFKEGMFSSLPYITIEDEKGRRLSSYAYRFTNIDGVQMDIIYKEEKQNENRNNNK